MIQKLIRQYGEHGNDYSPVEMGDRINEIIEFLQPNLKEQEKEIKIEVKDKNFTPLKEYAARSPSTADKVYLIKDGKKHWIKNPETLFKLGFNFQTIKGITNEEMEKFETEKPIDLKEPKILEVVEKKEDGNKYNL